MRTKEVAKLAPLERFIYWIRERHSIYLKKESGKPKPWTDDEVLQQYYFTNPYRENDKTTVWFRENIRDPLQDKPEVLFATVCFRWFNKIETGEELLKWGSNPFECFFNWNGPKVAQYIRYRVDHYGMKPFTGAYIIQAYSKLCPKMGKVEAVCKRLSAVWRNKQQILESIENGRTMQEACSILCGCDGLGKFMSYEITCDLRYTYLLRRATDKSTWCNQGPGAKRGMNRLRGKPLKQIIDADTWMKETMRLLAKARNELVGMPRLEMREIEHSLCEWDKYERAMLGNGRMKRRYQGV